MKKKIQNGWLQDILFMVVGTVIIALAVKCVFEPLDMVTGGFSGLAILIKEMTSHLVRGGIPLGVTSFVLNVPVFIWAFVKKGKEFAGKSFVAMILLSFWLAVIPAWDLSQQDLLIGCLFGGGLMGFGVGLVLRAHCTTGGTDMLAALLHIRLKQYSLIQIMQVIDALIVIAGLYLFGLKIALYAIFAIFVMMKVSDITVEGLNTSRAVYIMSDRSDEIAQALMSGLDRGVTGLNAKGMYTHKERCMLLCVVSKKQMVYLKETTMAIDPKAFLVISDAREVWGEGFQSYADKM